MVELTRRSLLEVSAAGAVGAGAAAGVATSVTAASGRAPSVSLPGDVVVHVLDLDRAELAVLTGTGELVVRDEELVARIAAVVSRMAGGD